MRRCQHLVHPSKQFWNWFCRMAFKAAVVLLLMSSLSSKCLPFNISFIFWNRKKSLGARSSEQAGYSDTVIWLVAKNSLTDSAVWAGALSWCKIHELLAESSGHFRLFFTQPFQYFQIVNFVDCLSSWYKFIINNPSSIKFTNFIVRPRIYCICKVVLVHFPSSYKLWLQRVCQLPLNSCRALVLNAYPLPPHSLSYQ